MSIAAIETAGMKPQQSTREVSSTLGKDDFLNLLVTQLQNQDPLKPMDSTEFTAQLAQFTSLEQLSNINTNLKTLRREQASVRDLQAVAFIGKMLEAPGDTVAVGNDTCDDLRFELAGDAKAVFANLYDPAGNYVRTLESGAMPAGRQSISWNGEDFNGDRLPEGRYSYEIMAVDLDRQPVDVAMYTAARVSGIRYQDGQPYLMAGGREVPLDEVRRIFEAD